jgi:radical SAM superfamily enzyme YgiQ (UPF0313 family)
MVAGGAHPTIDPQDDLKNTPIEVCIVGEGEETTTELIKKSRKKSNHRRRWPSFCLKNNGL